MLTNKVEEFNKIRGSYRTMNMKELRDHADDPIWHDGERFKLELAWPIPLKPWKDKRWTWKSWKQLVEQHIVDRERAPYTITDGVPDAELYELGEFWCAKSPGSHLSCFLCAIDFLVPDKTNVLAAHDGVISELVEDNDEWGDEQDEEGEYLLRNHLNYMTVNLDGVHRMQYCHLAKGSVSALGLQVGSRVKKGQPIGKVGKNGVTDRDHLHFIVFRLDSNPVNPFGFKSLVPRFTL